MVTRITLTLAGSDVGPFNLYSNIDDYTTPAVTGVSRTQLVDGYDATLPDWSTEVLVRSTGVCQRDMYLSIAGAPTTTTSTSTSSTTTSTSTTPPPTGNIYFSYNTFSVAFTIYSDVPVAQSVYISAAVSVTGYSNNSCITSIAAKGLTGGLLGLNVAGTIATHVPSTTSGTWGSSTPYSFDTLTIPLSINGGPTTSYVNGATVTIGSTLFTIHINKTCI
jgi:hypothetical protein